MPDQDFFKEVAAQLRKPTGEFGYEVAQKMNESNREMNLTIIAALDIKEGNNVLEVGMGNGFFIKDILSKADGINYVGCDYSQDMIKLASTLNSKFINTGQASFHQSEAHHLPVDNDSIDHLFTVNTIYFWDDIPSILSEFKRVLKKYGTLSIAIRPESCLRQYPSTQYDFEYYTSKQVIDLLIANGFTKSKLIEVKEAEIEILGIKVIPEYAVILATI